MLRYFWILLISCLMFSGCININFKIKDSRIKEYKVQYSYYCIHESDDDYIPNINLIHKTIKEVNINLIKQDIEEYELEQIKIIVEKKIQYEHKCYSKYKTELIDLMWEEL